MNMNKGQAKLRKAWKSVWEKPMKYLNLILVFVVVSAFAVFPVWSQREEVQEGIMDLKSKEFVQHQRPPVRFDHYLHETILRCRVCHHDFNVFSNRNEGKGSKCATCHKLKPNKDIPVPLLTAFHKLCKGCHENYAKWDRSTGPVMCGICHTKKLARSGN